MIALLDTHVIIWLATGGRELGEHSSRKLLKVAGEGVVAFSAISFWEIGTLAEKGRLGLMEDPVLLRDSLLDSGMEEIPLSGEAAVLSARLGLHRDPADRLIAATAWMHDAVLFTADELLLAWKHPLKRQDARL